MYRTNYVDINISLDYHMGFNSYIKGAIEVFRNNKIPKLEQVNVLFNDGGLGDHIARMTAIKYIRDTQPHIEMFLYVPDFFVDLAKNLVPNISIRSFVKKEKYNIAYPCIQTECPQHDTLGTHLVDHAFHVLVNKQVTIDHKNYCKLNIKKINIDKFQLPSKYVVVTTGFTAAVREWDARSVNETVKYIKSKGYIPVFLGNKVTKVEGLADAINGNFNHEIDYNAGISLVNKTTLLEAGKIIAQSSAIVGVDNGLCPHLAGTTDVPIITGFTTVNPRVRLPYRRNELGWNCFTVLPDDEIECRYCQSEWAIFYDHDFRECWYKDMLCVKSLTSDKFINELEKVL